MLTTRGPLWQIPMLMIKFDFSSIETDIATAREFNDLVSGVDGSSPNFHRASRGARLSNTFLASVEELERRGLMVSEREAEAIDVHSRRWRGWIEANAAIMGIQITGISS